MRGSARACVERMLWRRRGGRGQGKKGGRKGGDEGGKEEKSRWGKGRSEGVSEGVCCVDVVEEKRRKRTGKERGKIKRGEGRRR